MSGPIRRLIAPTKVRLQHYLEELPELAPNVEEGQPLQDTLAILVALRLQQQREFDRIKSAVELLNRSNTEWATIVANLPAAKQEQEN